MGAIFSRRSKNQQTTIEILQDLEKRIDDLETNRAEKEFNRRRAIGYLLIIAVVIFFISLGVTYFFVFHSSSTSKSSASSENSNQNNSLRHSIIFAVILIFYPAIVYCLKWTICFFYEQSVDADERKLVKLRREKREILDTVKDKETYKVAMEILERFDPTANNRRGGDQQQSPSDARRYSSIDAEEFELRNRRQQQKKKQMEQQQQQTPSGPRKGVSHGYLPALPAAPSIADPFPPTPQSPRAIMAPPTPYPPQYQQQFPPPPPPNRPPTIMRPNGPVIGGIRGPSYGGGGGGIDDPMMMPMQQTPIRLPRPVVPPNRSTFDKMIDYLLGEGPTNRYALICQRCHSHNGMALKEELETMSFRCCYCFAFNPARKLATSAQSSTNQQNPTGDHQQQQRQQNPFDTNMGDHNGPIITELPSPPHSPKHSPANSVKNQPIGGGGDEHGRFTSDSRAASRTSLNSLDSCQSSPPYFPRPSTTAASQNRDGDRREETPTVTRKSDENQQQQSPEIPRRRLEGEDDASHDTSQGASMIEEETTGDEDHHRLSPAVTTGEEDNAD